MSTKNNVKSLTQNTVPYEQYATRSRTGQIRDINRDHKDESLNSSDNQKYRINVRKIEL